MYKKSRYLAVVLLLGAFAVLPSFVYGANGANFVLYNHHTAEPGEMEIMLMMDIGQEPDGTNYTAQMVEFELGITERFTAEFMVEGQTTSGEDGYHFTGFRLEGRYRLFEYGTFLNPVLYVEYEDLSEDTKYVMEMSGREDASEKHKSRPSRERVLETRLILGHDITDRFDVALNWLNESDLDTGVTAFGYAVGLNYGLRAFGGGSSGHMEDKSEVHKSVTLGLEIFGGLGDSDKGLTANGNLTQHYFAPNLKIHATEKVMVKFGGAIGLTNVSQDIFRLALGYEF